MDGCDRVVILIDMDCFYVQVEQRRQPSLRGMPCAVVQYNKWKGGGIIAVSYEARARGVTRNMRGDDAKEKCSDIVLCMVPTANGKADLTRYRDAGAEVIQVLLQFGGVVERASVDEAYIDLTEVVKQKMESFHGLDDLPSNHALAHTYVVGFPKSPVESNSNSDAQLNGVNAYREQKNENVARLLIAASIVEEMRLAVYEQTSFRCSAGISHNKVLAKLACGINKPNKQTVLPMESVAELFRLVKIGKIRNLGGKLGFQLSQNLKIEYIGQLTEVPKSTLIEMHGVKTGEWLYEICRGIDHELVKERHLAQSVGCSKTFRGAEALNTRTKVKHWIGCLATELTERLIRDREINNRTSKSLTVCVGFHSNLKSISRACQISQYNAEDVGCNIMATLELLNQAKDRQADIWFPAITMIGVSAGKFLSDNDKSQTKLKAVKTNKKSFDNSATTSKDLDQANTHSPSKDLNPDFVTRLSASPKVPNNTQISNCNSHVTAVNRFTASPTKSVKDKDTSMDKKRLFFTQNFGVAGKLKPSEVGVVSLISPEKSINTSNRKSLNEMEKKQSFFAKMKANSKQQTPSCKIESAFEELTNIEHNENDRDEETLPETVDDSKLKKDLILNEVTTTFKQPPVKPRDELPYTSLSMDSIDMDVFNCLPLYLQHEIKSASRKCDSNSSQIDVDFKRRKLEASNGQTSIAGFFNRSPTPDPGKTSSKKSSAKKDKTKSRKGSLQFKHLEENAVPLGFFRARSQASAAIRNAVEKQAFLSQKRKTEEKLRKNPSSN